VERRLAAPPPDVGVGAAAQQEINGVHPLREDNCVEQRLPRRNSIPRQRNPVRALGRLHISRCAVRQQKRRQIQIPAHKCMGSGGVALPIAGIYVRAVSD
jgi:hypothetical protein